MANSGPGYEKNPSHQVAVESFKGRVLVRAKGEVLADTEHALQVNESGFRLVYYVPRGDAKMARLVPSDHHTRCPYKGEASYFSIVDGPANAVWSYEHPYDEVVALRDHLAFYPERVDSIEATPTT